jgi:hypothetical protein
LDVSPSANVTVPVAGVPEGERQEIFDIVAALPADAEIYYTGEDPRVGRLIKYRYVSIAD